MKYIFLTTFAAFFFSIANAQPDSKLPAKLEQLARGIEPKVIEWRRYFHQNPELSNREIKTAERRGGRS